MNDSDHSAVLEVVPGKSAGLVTAPDVELDLPLLTDAEVNEAAEELGLVKIKVGTLKSVRRLGQFARESGMVSLGRGFLLAGLGQLMDLADEAKLQTDAADNPEIKEKFLRIRRDCAMGLKGAGEKILEQENLPKEVLAPDKPALPKFGEQISPTTNIVANNVHLHANA